MRINLIRFNVQISIERDGINHILVSSMPPEGHRPPDAAAKNAATPTPDYIKHPIASRRDWTPYYVQ